MINMARKPQLCLWTGLLILAMGPSVFGQESAAYDVFLPPDHQLRRQLEDAKQAIDDGEFNDAVRLLGVLLVGDPDADDARNERAEVEDYFLEPPTEGAASAASRPKPAAYWPRCPRKAWTPINFSTDTKPA